MSRLHNQRLDHGVQATPAEYSESDLANANREHDSKPIRQPGHELGIPGFARLQSELSEEELTERVWQWHTKDLNS